MKNYHCDQTSITGFTNCGSGSSQLPLGNNFIVGNLIQYNPFLFKVDNKEFPENILRKKQSRTNNDCGFTCLTQYIPHKGLQQYWTHKYKFRKNLKIACSIDKIQHSQHILLLREQFWHYTHAICFEECPNKQFCCPE